MSHQIDNTFEAISLKTPTMTHPDKVRIKGIFFEVVSFKPLNFEDVQDIAKKYYLSRKFKKTDKGSTFQIVTLFGTEDAIY